MASRLNPYLTFPGTAREAVTFYQSVLGGDLDITTFGQFGGGGTVDPEGVMHAYLKTPDGFELMASDLAPGMEHDLGNNITISLSGDPEAADALRGYFSGLAEGGTVTMPLEKQMWGDDFGQLVDKFGIGWLVNISNQPTA